MIDTQMPLIERITSMLKSNPPKEYSTDPLLNLMYDKVVKLIEVDNCFDAFSWSTIKDGSAIRDVISDVYVFVKNDRPLQINKIIECEIEENYEELAECKEKLEEQDNYYLKLIIDHRNFIFTNN